MQVEVKDSYWTIVVVANKLSEVEVRAPLDALRILASTIPTNEFVVTKITGQEYRWIWTLKDGRVWNQLLKANPVNLESRFDVPIPYFKIIEIDAYRLARASILTLFTPDHGTDSLTVNWL